ncbi:hypothetical protein OS493_024554 [Desmophyllum pertusum]|uniref:Uncharacterized protein n=1 Tax=Desmophyllum pertusum TaxID=174260 RepID=A0A9X0D7R4_9CNID|nr:hypothetical protein OS493_024554 [Desmophyllum pertusum]
MKLAAAASFIHHHNSVTPRLLTFLSAPQLYYRLMIVPLIPPGVIDTNAKLVVKMAVGLETKFGQGESDPSFVISDGHRFIGMFTVDKNNYPSIAPCFGIEAVSGTTIKRRREDTRLPKPSETYYPGRFEIQLSLSDRWGTCFVPLDGGFSREMIYQNKLNPRNGLFLEIYGDDKQEKEGIKYIELSILQEN